MSDNNNIKRQISNTEVVFDVTRNVSKLRQYNNLFEYVVKNKEPIKFFTGKLCLINNKYLIFTFIQFKYRLRFNQISDIFNVPILEYYQIQKINDCKYYNPFVWNQLQSIPIGNSTFGISKETLTLAKQKELSINEAVQQLVARVLAGEKIDGVTGMKMYPQLTTSSIWQRNLNLLRLDYIKRNRIKEDVCFTYIFGNPGFGKTYFGNIYIHQKYLSDEVHTFSSWEWMEGLTPETKVIFIQEFLTKFVPYTTFSNLTHPEKYRFADGGISLLYLNKKFGHTFFLGNRIVLASKKSPFAINFHYTKEEQDDYQAHYQIWRRIMLNEHGSEVKGCESKLIYLYKKNFRGKDGMFYYYPLDVTELAGRLVKQLNTKYEDLNDVNLSYQDYKNWDNEFKRKIKDTYWHEIKYRKPICENEIKNWVDTPANFYNDDNSDNTKTSEDDQKKIDEESINGETNNHSTNPISGLIPVKETINNIPVQYVTDVNINKLNKDLTVGKSSWEELKYFLENNHTFAVDVETIGAKQVNKEDKNPSQKIFYFNQLRTLQLSNGEESFYIPFETSKNVKIISEIKKYLRNKRLVFHHWKFDIWSLESTLKLNIRQNNQIEDTYLQAKCMDSLLEPNEYSLFKLTKRYLNNDFNWKELITQIQKTGGFRSIWDVYTKVDTLTNYDFIQYCLLDVYWTFSLYNYFRNYLNIDCNKTYTLKLEDSLLSYSEEKEGLKFNQVEGQKEQLNIQNKLKNIHKEFKSIWNDFESFEALKYPHSNCFFSSPLQINNWLKLNFSPDKLTVLNRGENKDRILYPTSKRNLVDLLPDKGINLIINHKKLLKDYGFWNKCIEFSRLNSESKIFPVYDVFGTKTGRWSCVDPNLQQLPKEDKSKIRLAIDYDYSIDFNQQELRMMALLSRDDNLLTEIKKHSLHESIAQNLNTDIKTAKIFNFSIPYGISKESLRKILLENGKVFTLKQTEELVEKWWRRFPDLKFFNDWLKGKADYAPFYKNPFDRTIRFNFPYTALNYIIQGSCSDLFTKFWRSLRSIPGVKVVGKIHDEYWIKTKLSQSELEERVKEIEITIKHIAFPLSVHKKGDI